MASNFFEDFKKAMAEKDESDSSDESSGEQSEHTTNHHNSNNKNAVTHDIHEMTEDWFSDGSEFSVDESRLAPGLLDFVPRPIKITDKTISNSEREHALKKFAAKYARVQSDPDSNRDDGEDDGKERDESSHRPNKKRFDVVDFYENDPETKWFDPNFVKRQCDQIGIRDDMASLWMDPYVWGDDYWNRRGFTKDSNSYKQLLTQFLKVCDRKVAEQRDKQTKAKIASLQPRSVQQQSRSKISRSSTHPIKGISSSSSSAKHNIGKHLHRSQSDLDAFAPKKSSKKVSSSSSSRKRGFDGGFDHDNLPKRRRKSRWGDRHESGKR